MLSRHAWLFLCALVPSVALADEPRASGIDVSEWQGTIDWPKVAASGRDFAFTRVSDGTAHPDDTFDRNWTGIKDAGMVRGAYQFFRPNADPVAQANLLASKVDLKPGDLPPVLDVEVTDGASSEQIARNIDAWARTIREKMGVKPIIYVSPGFWSGLSTKPNLDGIDVWVAHWGVSSPDTPSGWNDWSFWQTSSTGSVPGIGGRVDTDQFHGSVADLKAYASAHGVQPPAPPPPPPPPHPIHVIVKLGDIAATESGLPVGPNERLLAGPRALERLADMIADPRRKDGTLPKIGRLTIDASGVDAFTEISTSQALETGLARVRAKLDARGLQRSDVFASDANVNVKGTLADPAAVDRALQQSVPVATSIVDTSKPASNGLIAFFNKMNAAASTPPPVAAASRK